MSWLRKRLSVPITWGMIPLALWAGMPSAACRCANGQVKFFCKNALGANDCPGPRRASARGGEATDFQWDAAANNDCCGGGSCRHVDRSTGPGVTSKNCCKPIVTAPNLAPETVKLPCGQTPLFFQSERPAESPPFALIADVAEVDTGPPLDRVVFFRSLLI